MDLLHSALITGIVALVFGLLYFGQRARKPECPFGEDCISCHPTATASATGFSHTRITKMNQDWLWQVSEGRDG